ncbi:MobC family plasmid mobilization relaxosome protein, partial [Klebsiella pneumoniae]
ARSLRLPSIDPVLLRQLAGMGNNLNQIARKINGGQWSGADRVQVVAALMAIDAELERLRHAVLEKGADDDR